MTPPTDSGPRDFDFLRLGEKARVTRGTPIEKLPDLDHIYGDVLYQLVEKMNEVIDRLNQMNEVSP